MTGDSENLIIMADSAARATRPGGERHSDPEPTPPSWSTLDDLSLLHVRIRDLGLSIVGSPVEPRVKRLYHELEARGLALRPRIYLGDEWFSPEGVVAIAVPFYLAHPRLAALERSMMLEVEGADEEYCMKLLRHEAGHCFDHAYRASRQKEWRKLFGEPGEDYSPESYRPRRYSRSFVRNLNAFYAQAHPDEDFAETFAVWLNPAVDWLKEYAAWPVALRKLEYVDRIARRLGARPHARTAGRMPYDAGRLATTLARHYARRKREQEADFPDFYDKDLKAIFSGDPALPKREHAASRFMARYRKALAEQLRHWTGEPKYAIHDVIRRLMKRSDEIGLRVGRGDTDTLMALSAYLGALFTHYRFTGELRRRDRESAS